nr:uncharacterized protein LOC111427894 [Onthophagus taurus]
MAYAAISYVATALFCVVTVVATQDSYGYDYNPHPSEYTRPVTLKQGSLLGIIVQKRVEDRVIVVEQYLGIPYAKPPVGDLRFMPPVNALPWTGIKYADVLKDVCPQIRPNFDKMEHGRKMQVKRLHEYLKNESEDCLYLNIYAPYQDGRNLKKYPVMVYINGESFEWNSGNAYDGSILAEYGKVIVVTLNFRLGVLGFLQIDRTTSNFGLIDQIAALLWIKQNIASFGGDPNKVTLFGHGTGAACINHLMLSPMINYYSYGEKGVQNNTFQKLFQRAILMSGSALSDWALATNPSDVMQSVAKALGCGLDQESLINCLRKKRLYDVLDAVPPVSQYETRFGPVVDGRVIPDSPEKMMKSDILSSFEVMYGVTELESVHLLGNVALNHGLLEREFRSELSDYMDTRCESKSFCVEHIIGEYKAGSLFNRDSPLPISPFDEAAGQARDILLDLLSDARTAAPVVMMGKLHSTRNSSSYFYVFGHSTASRTLNLQANKTIHGEDLPFVFGVPLDTNPGQRFTRKEVNISKMMMSLWSNFAYTGDPNNYEYTRRQDLTWSSWYEHGIKWPEYDSGEQYLHINIPPVVKSRYREDHLNYWNEDFAQIKNIRIDKNKIRTTYTPYVNRYRPSYKITTKRPIYPITKQEAPTNHIQTQKPNVNSGSSTNVIITLAVVFLLINVSLFTFVYYKCVVLKRKNCAQNPSIEEAASPTSGENNIELANKVEINENGCNIMRIIGTKSSKSGDTYEAVKTHKTGSSKRKLKRQFSSSTIDAHTKVREWIAQEIVNKYSPKADRKNTRQISLDSKNSKNSKSSKNCKKKNRKSKDFNDIMDTPGLAASSSTLGQSPTRPVSPAEEIKDSPKFATLKKKAEKVSVAIDATPAGRGSSVMRQEPIELTKSLDYSSFDSSEREIPLRRSATLDDVWSMKPQSSLSKRNSTSINLQLQQPNEDESTVIKIEHYHSKSDPVDTKATPRKLKTFDPGIVNVTSRDEPDHIPSLSPEESLQVIKRRNCPKVLPDLPGFRNNSSQKRRSMPAPSYLFLPIPENSSFSQPNSPCTSGSKPIPPPPPPRVSTLGRTPQSYPRLAEEPPLPEEPEVACNNLYIGPLIPSRENRKVIMKPADNYSLDNQPIYDNLNPKSTPKTIITADNQKRKIEPKVIIKPTISRTISDPSKSKGPRVVVNDNFPLPHLTKNETEKSEEHSVATLTRQISTRSPSPLKDSTEQKESSTDSTPSEASDTGTVVKK